MKLSESERIRYSRQIMIWGEEGQAKLKSATVGVLGAGGLGSPISIYLAVAGVGKIILCDGDKVELSNLNRQILHWDIDIGREKTKSAEEKLRLINPDIGVVCIHKVVDERSIREVFGDVDCIVDALDNFATRFLLNDFAVRKKIPLFHGAVWGFEGRVTTVVPGETACLRCTYTEAPPRETFPIVGVTPALIGQIQTMEVIKYITGIGRLLLNELLVIDGERMTFSKFRLKRKEDCQTCGGI
jgi:adenylyltransferase/sulfurtransferase